LTNNKLNNELYILIKLWRKTMEIPKLENLFLMKDRIPITAKYYILDGIGFVATDSNYYPRKGEPLSSRIRNLFEQIDFEIGKRGLRKYLEN
jgi:hypothetical protein